MKKSLIALLTLTLVLCLALVVVGCGHEHTTGTEYTFNATSHQYKCPDCGEFFGEEAHDMKVVEEVASTCQSAGHKVESCVCGYEKTTNYELGACTPGTPAKENETPATCQGAGSYDMVTRCTVCNEVLNTEHVDDPIAQHTAGTPAKENEVLATCQVAGSYDMVTRCTVCNEVMATEHVTGQLGDCTFVFVRDSYEQHHEECTACGSKKAAVAHEFADNLKCACGEYKTLSVTEAKAYNDKSVIFNVKGVICGWTGNYDGGYCWIVLKDLNSNEVIGMRKGLKADLGTTADISPMAGYSYSPTSYFELGDIVVMPTSAIVNSASQGGENGKPMLFFRGEAFNSQNAREWINKYKVGHTEDYKVSMENPVFTINSQDTLEEYCLSYSYHWKIVKLVGTAENPLKFTTQSATTAGKGNIQREYLYMFYDAPTKLDEQRINGAAPVLSNFGNLFNLSNTLSATLFGQTAYEALNFNNPYYFEGEMYVMLVGGSTAYFHMIVLGDEYINKTGGDASVDHVAPRMGFTTFLQAMEKKAKDIGIQINNPINSAVGVSYSVSCEDFVKIGIAALEFPQLMPIWNTADYQTTIKDIQGNDKNIAISNAILYNESCIADVQSKYKIVGAKSGALNSKTDARPYYVANMLMLVEGPNDTILVACVAEERQPDEPEIRYKNLAILYDIVVAKANNQDTTALEAQLTIDYGAVAMVPKDAYKNNGYDWFGADSQYVTYSKNGSQKIVSASMWKTFTSVVALTYIQDLSYEMTMLSSDDNSTASNPSLEVGDTMTFEQALYFIFVTSSNVTPTIIARTVGQYILLNNIPL